MAQALQTIRDVKRAAVLHSLRNGARRNAAAAAAGVDVSTLWRWMKSDPHFAELVTEAEAQAVVSVESALFRRACEPAGTAERIFFLKTRAGYMERASELLIELKAKRMVQPVDVETVEPCEVHYVVTARLPHPEPEEALEEQDH